MVEEILQALVNIAEQIIAAIPAVILAIIIIILGYVIGAILSKAIRLIYHHILWKFLKRTAVGKKLDEMEVDLGWVLGSIVHAVVVALAILLAINALGFLGPALEFIRAFINIVIGVLGGIVVLVIGIPLAVLASEGLAKLIGLALGGRNGAIQIIQTLILVVLLMFILGLAVAVMTGSPALLQAITLALPSGFMAAIIILAGFIIATLVGDVVKVLVEKLAKPLEATDIGAGLKTAGIDLPWLIAGLVRAIVIVLAITVGIGYIIQAGVAAEVLGLVSFYLPRILAAIAILTLGLALALILAKYIGKLFRTIAKDRYTPLGDLVETIIGLGLVAAFVTIALNVLALYGDFIYSLIMGTVIISIGIVVVDKLIEVLKPTHPSFEKFLPLIGATFVFVFVYIGVSAILSQISGAVDILRIIALGVAIALAVMIIPVVFYIVRLAWREAASTQ